MILVETVLGKRHEGDWPGKLQDAEIVVLKLDQWDSQKNRLRKKTHEGVEVAIALDRGTQLQDGDVLHWDEASRTAIVVELQLQDVMVIDLSGLLEHSQKLLAQTCVELGHALGNQHWPAVVKDTAVYVPLTVDRQVMAAVMKTHAFAGIRYSFVSGMEVIPYLAPHEARRLFGGADATPHSHVHEHLGNAHAHGHPHSHRDHDHSGENE